MKRSEALDKILDYLKEHSIHEISPEEILDLVEQDIGMLPPLNDYINKWEEELDWKDM